MKLSISGRAWALSALILSTALILTPSSASAAASVDVGVVVPVAPAPVYPRVVGDGHYELRTERVLIAPERRERVWVEPVYQTQYYRGAPQTVMVAQGYWHESVVPAQYELHTVQVWVPGPVVTYVRPAPSVGLGLDFNFFGRRHW